MKKNKLTVPLMERADAGNQSLNGTCVSGRSRDLLLEIRELLNVFAPSGDDYRHSLWIEVTRGKPSDWATFRDMKCWDEDIKTRADYLMEWKANYPMASQWYHLSVSRYRGHTYLHMVENDHWWCQIHDDDDKHAHQENMEWLLDLWCNTVDKRDTIYILGDLMFLKSEDARRLLEKLPGRKFLIEGKHDGSIRAYHNYFKEVYQIKEMRFKPTVAPFLKEDFSVVMCHYPMVTWNQKPLGSVMLHGHSHGRLDEYNAQSMDLRFDVGIDGELANLRFLTLEDIYNAATEKITQYKCDSFAEYAKNNYRGDVR